MSKRGLDLNIKNILSDKSERAMLIICVGIAFVFWIFSKLSKTYNSDIQVHLEYILPDKNSILTKKPPPKLDVTLDGTGWNLMFNSIHQRSPKLEYRLNQDTFQEIRLQRLTRDLQFKLGFGANIGTINPDFIPLVMDVKARKRIPIKLINKISLEEQFVESAAKTILPDTIVIEGPSSIIQNIKEWHTLPLEVNKLSHRLKDTISLAPYPNPQVRFIPNFVAYDVFVEQLTEKEVEVPIILTEKKTDVLIFPKSIKVKCTIGLSNYEKLTPALFHYQVDISKGKNGIAEIIVVKEPSFLKFKKHETETIQYFIIKNSGMD
jgi:hypothetical protein